MKRIQSLLLIAASLALPMVAGAQILNTKDAGNLDPIKKLVENLSEIINLLIPVAVALLFLAFIWGLVLYVKGASGNEESREKGKEIMIAGIISLFVVVTIWGIISFLAGALFGNTASGIGGKIIVPEVEESDAD